MNQELRNEGLHNFWFSTNTSAIRTGHWLKRPKACIYFVDANDFHGLMLTGQMQVCTDDETKQAFWKKGNYYHGLQKCLFSVDEILE